MVRLLLLSLLFSYASCYNSVSLKDSTKYGFTTENILFNSETFNLKGTLDIPKYSGQKPAIIIIPGSGSFDRDGSSLEKPIYKIWSNYFAVKGFITLRFDKRFLTHKNLGYEDITQATQIADAEAAVNYILSRSDVDSSKVFMIGHSEGGSIIPSVSATEGKIKGLVIISASAIPIDSLFLAQLENNTANPLELIEQTHEAFTMLHNGTFPENGQIFGGGKQYWLQWIQLTSKADSIVLKQQSRTLYIQGLNDENFPNTTGLENLKRWKNIAIKSNGKIKVTEYEGITHLLLKETTRDTSEALLFEIVNWLKE